MLFSISVILVVIISIALGNTRCITRKTYDYIIVGAGTAGSALASELSRDGDSVLLIEEGGWSNQHENVLIASMWWSTLTDPQIERGYTTTPQTELNNRVTWYPRAKVTGGCNSHNAMVWILGNRADFDDKWNINNWSWDNDLKYYWNYIESTFKTETLDPNEYFMQKFIKSAQLNGHKYNPDPNDLTNNNQGGVSARRFMGEIISETVALRESSWTAYIEPILGSRDNLDVIIYTRVNRILFDQSSSYKTFASGVETVGIGDHKIHRFYARKEVILSAGVIDSPKILMLSGIGDCDELSLLNIECVRNIKGVGKSLQDHTFSDVWSPPLKDQDIELPPELFSSFGVLVIDDDGEYYNSLTIGTGNDENKLAIGSFAEPFHYESRGEVLLRDNNPESLPIINPNFLSTINDQNKFIKVINKSRELIYTTELMDLFEDQEYEISPGWNIQTDEEILEWGRKTTETDFHPAGTCKMGNNFNDDTNDMIVVDNRLRVKGIDNLRIVDGSIMPELISGNPNQITLIIGLKAADIILKDNGGNGGKVYNIK